MISTQVKVTVRKSHPEAMATRNNAPGLMIRVNLKIGCGWSPIRETVEGGSSLTHFLYIMKASIYGNAL